MEELKFEAGFVCGEWDEFAYPCYLRKEHWNGWAMPYFRLKDAKAVAREMKGRYDKERDAFIFNYDGEDDAFAATTIKVRGRNVKVYPIGTGYWCWDVATDLKIYAAYWSKDFANAGTQQVVEYFFSEERCYDKEAVAAIKALEIGETWRSPDYGSNHTVTRTK
jgi:hypothetical protein